MGLPYVARAYESVRHNQTGTWESPTVRGAMALAERHAKPSNRVAVRAAYTSDGSFFGVGGGRQMAYSEGSYNGKRQWQVESTHDARTEHHRDAARDPKRPKMKIHMGRGEGVPALWYSPETYKGERWAVVRTFHSPPRYLVVKKSAGSWLTEKEFSSFKAAAREARRLSGRAQRPISSRRDPGLDKKALHKSIDKDIAAAQKRKLKMLHGELSVARKVERNACGIARMSARARIQKLRDRKAKIQVAIARAIARERAMKNETCAARPRVTAAKKAWQDERAYQASLKRSASAARLKGRPGLRSTRAARKSESDDEVRHNIPAHLHGLWRRVKSGIRATPRMSRTEAFMKYVEEHPREEFADADDATDALIADLERQNRSGRRDMSTRHIRYRR